MARNLSTFSYGDQCPVLKAIVTKQNNMYDGREGEKKLLQILYGIVVGFGLAENLFVILTILSHRALRNIRTSFIAHLACSDLMLCALTAPTTLWFTFNSFWNFGQWACKMVASLQAINTFISLLTLTAIAWDRYLLIIFPIRWRRPNKALLWILSGVWALSLLVAAPYFVAVGTEDFRRGFWNSSWMDHYLEACGLKRPRVCTELFPGSGFFSKRTFTVAVFVCQYLLPLSGLLFVYGNIVRHTLTGRKNSVARRSPLQRVRKKQRNTIFLVTALVLVFGVCWLPSNLYCTLDALGVLKFDQFRYIYFHLFGMVTACINPVLYGLLNKNIQKSVALTVRSCFGFAKNAPASLENVEMGDRAELGRTFYRNGLTTGSARRTEITRKASGSLRAKQVTNGKSVNQPG